MTEPAPWTRIYNRIKAQIPAAPDAVIRQEIWSVMIDFTQDTNIWVEEIPIVIQPNVTTYPFTTTFGRAHRLMMVFNPDNNTNTGRFRWAQGGITMRIPGILELGLVP